MKELKILSSLSKNPKLYLSDLESRARFSLIKRYDKPLSFHDKKLINDILFNEKTHYVETFKEYLLYEDYNEFLKQYYFKKELYKKLSEILYFYEKYSKIFPNYTTLPESKYLYKNIKRKQKIIDQMNNNISYYNNRHLENTSYNISEEELYKNKNQIFDTNVIDSIYSNNSSNIFLNKKKTIDSLKSNNDIKKIIKKIIACEKKTKSLKLENKTKTKKLPTNTKTNNYLNNSTSIISPNITINKIKNMINNNNFSNVNTSKNKYNHHKLFTKPYNFIPKQFLCLNKMLQDKKFSSSNLRHKNSLFKMNTFRIDNNSIIKHKNENNTYSNLNSILENILNKNKKVILPTNSIITPKILNDIVFLSPSSSKNLLLNKKILENKKKSNINIYSNNKNNFYNFLHNNNSHKIIKCKIHKKNKTKELYNYHPNSFNKFYYHNISSIKNNRSTKNSFTTKNSNKLNENSKKIIENYLKNAKNLNTSSNVKRKNFGILNNNFIEKTKSFSIIKIKKKSKTKSVSKLGTENNEWQKLIKQIKKNKSNVINMNLNLNINVRGNSKEPYTDRYFINKKLLELLGIYCHLSKKSKKQVSKEKKFAKKCGLFKNKKYTARNDHPLNQNKKLKGVKTMNDLNKNK